jgi:hypothetical protein
MKTIFGIIFALLVLPCLVMLYMALFGFKFDDGQIMSAFILAFIGGFFTSIFATFYETYKSR